jgi:hypothetical protein
MSRFCHTAPLTSPPRGACPARDGPRPGLAGCRPLPPWSSPVRWLAGRRTHAGDDGFAEGRPRTTIAANGHEALLASSPSSPCAARRGPARPGDMIGPVPPHRVRSRRRATPPPPTWTRPPGCAPTRVTPPWSTATPRARCTRPLPCSLTTPGCGSCGLPAPFTRKEPSEMANRKAMNPGGSARGARATRTPTVGARRARSARTSRSTWTT